MKGDGSGGDRHDAALDQAIEALVVHLNESVGLGAQWRRLDEWERDEIRDRWKETIARESRYYQIGEKLLGVLSEYPAMQNMVEEMPRENRKKLKMKWDAICLGAVPRLVREQRQWSDQYAESSDPYAVDADE